jgi:hypothetical protein
MVDLSQKQKPRRGRIFPEIVIPPEELARRKAERTKLGLRCRAIFERIRPELIDKYYNWFKLFYIQIGIPKSPKGNS